MPSPTYQDYPPLSLLYPGVLLEKSWPVLGVNRPGQARIFLEEAQNGTRYWTRTVIGIVPKWMQRSNEAGTRSGV